MSLAPPEPLAVVILDDDPVLVSALARMLREELQVAVTGFTAGAAAMAWLSLHPANLLITDNLMPGPSGIDVTRWLRTQPGHQTTPVLMLTGIESPSLTTAALAAGVSRLIAKPVRASQLVREVQALLSPRPTSGPPL